MKSYSEFITEAFNTPLSWKWKEDPKGINGLDPRRLARSAFRFHANFKADGVNYTVELDSPPSLPLFELSFYRDRNPRNPSKGLGLKVLATVLDVTRDFIKKVDPDRVSFSAEKKDFAEDELDRASVYKKMANRFMPSTHEVKTEENPNFVDFQIRKKKQ